METDLLIISFHGWYSGEIVPRSSFKVDGKNIELYCPHDRNGYLRSGTWWLGKLKDNQFDYVLQLSQKIYYNIKRFSPKKLVFHGQVWVDLDINVFLLF